MKCFATLLLLLGATISYAQNPQVPITGNIGAGFNGPLINSPSVIFASDANHTMAWPETSGSSGVLVVTSAVSLTATRQVIAPQGKFTWQVKNATTGGQSITFGGSTGATVTIANGATATVVGDGTNYTSPSSGGGGTGTVTNVSVATANGFQGSVANPGTTPAISVNVDSSHYLPSTTDQGTWNAKAAVNGTPVATHCAEWLNATTLEDTGSPCGSSSGGMTQLTGDVAAGPGSGSQAATVQQIEGAAIPASSGFLGTNASKQLVTPTPVSQLNGVPAFEYQNAVKPSLSTFVQALQYAETTPVNIVVIGDSYSICDLTNCIIGPNVSTNRWPEQIRLNLQGKYGSHGTGVVPINQGGNVVNPEEWTVAGTTDWLTSSLGPVDPSTNALLHLAAGATATFSDSRGIKWDTLHLYCMTNAASGSIAVSIDSGAYTGTACNTTTGSPTAHVFTLATGAAAATHTVTFTSTGDSYIYAADGTAGTTGVTVSNIAMGETRAQAYGNAPAAQLAFSDLIPGGTQLTIVMLQTNDVQASEGPTNFNTYMTGIITHQEGLSPSSPVMLAIPPVSSFDPTGTNSAPYTAVQLNLCATLNIACINVQDHGTTLNGTKLGFGPQYNSASAQLWDQVHSPGSHPGDEGSLDEAALIYEQAIGKFLSSGGCTTNCTFTGTTTAIGPAFPLTVTATDATNYTGINYVGTGITPGWKTGEGNGSETAFGVANKFFWYNNQMRMALDSSGDLAVGYTTPYPTTFTCGLFCVGTSGQFNVSPTGVVNGTRATFTTTSAAGPALTLTTTDTNSYSNFIVAGSGGVPSWQIGEGNGAETAFGVAGKFYWYNSNMVMAIDSVGNLGIGHTTPYPTNFPAMLSVGTSSQFTVDSVGDVTAPKISSPNIVGTGTSPLTLGASGGYTGPLNIPAFCPGGGSFNLFSFAVHAGNPDRVTLGSCAELDLLSASGIGGFIGDVSHSSDIAWDGAGHTNISNLGSGTGSNSDLNGEVTLVAGTGTQTFALYDSSVTHPICTANDENATPSPVGITFTGGSGTAWTAHFTIAGGTSTDTVMYICTGRAN